MQRLDRAADLVGLGIPLQAGQGQQVLDDGIQPVGLSGDDLQETVGVFSFVHGTAEQGFHGALDGRDRGFQFMRDVGDKIAADVLEALQPGDVVEHHQRAEVLAPGVTQGRPVRLQEEFRPADKQGEIRFDS